MKDKPPSAFRASGGTVLFLAMVFMLMLSLVTMASLQTATLQLRMAGNNQFMEEAFNKAQAIAAELSQNPDNFSLELMVGHSNCPRDSQQSNCERSQLAEPRSAVVPESVTINYLITRQAPLVWKSFPLRESQSVASSAGNADVAIFEIDVRVDGSANRLGVAHLVQGVAVRVAALH